MSNAASEPLTRIRAKQARFKARHEQLKAQWRARRAAKRQEWARRETEWELRWRAEREEREARRRAYRKNRESRWSDTAYYLRTRPLAELLKFFGLKPGCSFAELKRAYRVKAQKLHPDKGGSHKAFTELQEIYSRAEAWFK
ncbi:MAG: J domain-containing protein [Pseudomonadota bacterium]